MASPKSHFTAPKSSQVGHINNYSQTASFPKAKTFVRKPHLITLSDGFTPKEAEEAYVSCTPDIKTRISALANARPELGGSTGG